MRVQERVLDGLVRARCVVMQRVPRAGLAPLARWRVVWCAVIEWWSEGAGEGPWDRGEEFFFGSRIV